ncbi:fimbrillin family protein [Bacteroides hominis]|uniref:fimbrillin family protein n=1 Tax=Bacteroides hominis TaxID=2763023 RepID=UPI00164A3650|nr:fimbrillin family protein [Bacteroides hominis (ex Liu et al. 2022)]MBC5612760.1 fimbrillin family protein [Bacteroides hominis (ex Liu et al. 2022)]MCS2833223.1 fimbrillin family protein [Bacteroides fragilis]
MKKQALLILAAAALLAGCSSEENEGMTAGDGRVALQVSSGIDVQTRAHDGSWDKGDAIGIYMLDGGAPESSNCKYTTTAEGQQGSFTAAEGQTIYFPTNGDTRDFIAYYPWRDLKESTTYNVDVTDQSTQEAIDLMGAAKVTDKSKDDPAVAFTFTHKLVKLYMNIRPDGNSLNSADMEGLKVTITKQQTKATYDVLAGGGVTVDTSGDAKEITLKTASDGTSAEGIVLPAEDTGGMLLTFKLKDQTTFTWAVKNAEKSQKFIAGNKYLYTITVGKTALEVTSTVTDWTPGNGEDGESGSAQ